MDQESFHHYSTAIKKTIPAKRKKKQELKNYQSNLIEGIAQLSTYLESPESHPLVLALQEEVTSSNKKLHDVVN